MMISCNRRSLITAATVIFSLVNVVVGFNALRSLSDRGNQLIKYRLNASPVTAVIRDPLLDRATQIIMVGSLRDRMVLLAHPVVLISTCYIIKFVMTVIFNIMFKRNRKTKPAVPSVPSVPYYGLSSPVIAYDPKPLNSLLSDPSATTSTVTRIFPSTAPPTITFKKLSKDSWTPNYMISPSTA